MASLVDSSTQPLKSETQTAEHVNGKRVTRFGTHQRCLWFEKVLLAFCYDRFLSFTRFQMISVVLWPICFTTFYPTHRFLRFFFPSKKGFTADLKTLDDPQDVRLKRNLEVKMVMKGVDPLLGMSAQADRVLRCCCFAGEDFFGNFFWGGPFFLEPFGD